MRDETGACVACGAIYTKSTPRRRTCSYGCAQKWAGMTRKAKAAFMGIEYDESVNVADLVERDGLTCALCGLPCLPLDEQQGTHDPLRASVDHVEPFARGGGHTWENVQVAHLLCNCARNDGGEERHARPDELRRRVNALHRERKGLV